MKMLARWNERSFFAIVMHFLLFFQTVRIGLLEQFLIAVLPLKYRELRIKTSVTIGSHFFFLCKYETRYQNKWKLNLIRPSWKALFTCSTCVVRHISYDIKRKVYFVARLCNVQLLDVTHYFQIDIYTLELFYWIYGTLSLVFLLIE